VAEIIQGRGVTPGRVEGRAFVCPGGLTGWGGVDPLTGIIKDVESPFCGQSIQDVILVLPGSRGSNGWSCYFTATHLAGKGPKAMVVSRVDSSVGVALACMNIPAVVDFAPADDPCFTIPHGARVIVDGTTGTVEIIG